MFCLDILVPYKNGFIRKIRSISKPGKQTIAVPMFPNITGSKSNRKIKFGQLIENNMRKSFLEKSYTKCGGEIIPRIFFKKSKLSKSLDV